MTDRDRDQAGRPRNARPRDAAGRPLPRGQAGVAPLPDDLRLTVDEGLVEAQRLLDAGRPFAAHEVLESLWKQADDVDERQLWRGLAQLMVGLTHLQRGNHRGARSLLERGGATLREAGEQDSVDVDSWVAWSREAAAATAAHKNPPAPPRLAAR